MHPKYSSHLNATTVAALLIATATACSDDAPTAPSATMRAGLVGTASSVTTTVPASLPLVTPSAAPTPVTGKSIAVHAGGNLQLALNTALRGDEIVLDAGATFTGNFILPAKAGSAANGWITIRSTAMGSLPPAGTRVVPMVHAAAMPKLVATSVAPALATAPGASGWRIIGVEMTFPSTLTAVHYGIVLLGDGTSAQNTLAKVPQDLILDRVFVHGQPKGQTKRCIGLNSGSTVIIDSYISVCKGSGYDSQAIGGWNGPGPYYIHNNRLEGAGENIMFGGADPAITDLVTSDVTISGNYISKPRSWQNKYTVKNLLELKNAQRVLIEGNVLRNHWVNAQSGFAIVFGSVNQSGRCTWCIVQDVTFRSNWLDSTAAGFNMFQGYANSLHARRLTIQNNLFTAIGAAGLGSNGKLFVLQGDLQDITIENNTGFSSVAYLHFGDPTAVLKDRLNFRNNVGGGATYNLHSPLGMGTQMFTLYGGTTYTATGNVIVGAISGGMPPGNSNVATVGTVGFVNPVTPNGNWALQPASALIAKGQGGTVPGIDWPTFASLTTGVDR